MDEIENSKKAGSAIMTIKSKKWKILVIEDDDDALANTVKTLMGIKVLDRELEIVKMASAVASDGLIVRERDFSVILLNVNTKMPHLGLSLVSRIRRDYDMEMTRIIVKTEESDYAPEQDVIMQRGIDDYVLKPDTLGDKTITVVDTAIKAYDQLWRMKRVKDGMEQILVCSNKLLATEEIKPFADICMQYLVPVMGEGASGALAYTGITRDFGILPLCMLSATSEHLDITETMGESVLPDQGISTVKKMMLKAVEDQKSIKTDTDWYIYIKISATREVVLWVNKSVGFDEIDEKLVDYFASTIKTCIDRLAMLRERMERAMVSMGILAHEFRTPIASMLMSYEYMLNAVESNKFDAKRFHALLKNAGQILNRLNRHIDSSINNAGIVLKDRLLLPVANENIGAIIMDAIDINKMTFSKAGKLEVHIEDNCWAQADRVTLEQVFVNLMSNAIKALSVRKDPVPGPQIEINLFKQDALVILRVSDRGIGIKPDQIDKIFEPFYSSSGIPSHGLGLTMAKKAIEAMGGTITCTSTFGEGTTFEIHFRQVNR